MHWKRVFAFIACVVVSSSQAAEVQNISLAEYVSVVLEQNFEVKAQRLEEQISVLNVALEEAAFSPYLTAGAERSEAERPNTVEQQRSQLFAAEYVARSSDHDAGIEGLLAYGTRYRVGYVLQRGRNNLNDFDSEWVSFAGVNLVQPLLKGRGRDAAEARLHLAEQQAEAAAEQLRRQLATVVAQGEQEYWGLVLAQLRCETYADSVKAAAQIAADAAERKSAGKMSELDVLQAQAGVQLRNTRLANARHQRRESVARMRTLAGQSALTVAGALRPVDRPAAEETATDIERSVRLARELHPEFRLQQIRVEQEELRVVYAKNQTLPQLDLTASFGLNGLGDDLASSWDDLERRDFETWAVGVEFRVPLGKDPAEAEYDAALLRKRQALLGLKSVDIQLQNVVDAAIERVHTAYANQQSLAELASFNERVLAAEMDRLRAGKSDSRRVLEAEEDLAEAKLAYAESLVEYENARLSLEVAEGSFLQTRAINVSVTP